MFAIGVSCRIKGEFWHIELGKSLAARPSGEPDWAIPTPKIYGVLNLLVLLFEPQKNLQERDLLSIARQS